MARGNGDGQEVQRRNADVGRWEQISAQFPGYWQSLLQKPVGGYKQRQDVPRPAGYTIIDVETTGLTQEDRILQLAVVECDADAQIQNSWEVLINPEIPIKPEAESIHKISSDDLINQPVFADVSDRLFAALDGKVFVAHNSDFDLGFIKREFARTGVVYEPVAEACTYTTFRVLEPQNSNKLEDIAGRLGIELTNAHDALSDAIATQGLLANILKRNVAPESTWFDKQQFYRLRSIGDVRPTSKKQRSMLYGRAKKLPVFADGNDVKFAELNQFTRAIAGENARDLNSEQFQMILDALDGLKQFGRAVDQNGHILA